MDLSRNYTDIGEYTNTAGTAGIVAGTAKPASLETVLLKLIGEPDVIAERAAGPLMNIVNYY
jgi:hypothetical protein